jgi:asparagine synthase (glutamine-hydrolysing)
LLLATWGVADAHDELHPMLERAGRRCEGGVRRANVDGLQVAVGTSAGSMGAELASRLAIGAEERWFVVFEGRLDESPAGVEDDGFSQPARTVQRLLARGGPSALDVLRGEFALIAYDRTTRTLIAARDRIGVRPLYFTFASGRLWIATSLQVLARVPGIRLSPEPLSLARALVARPTEYDATLIDGIRPVGPGSVVAWPHPSESPPAQVFAWAPDPWAIDTKTPPEELAAALRDHLTAAVRVRLDSVSSTGILASGGLDSSSVAALVARATPSSRATLFSFVTPGLGCDETRYIASLAAHTQISSVCVEPPAAGYTPDDGPWLELFHPSFVGHRTLAYEARTRGVRRLLTGEGSDELQGFCGREAEDRMRVGAILAAARFAGLWDEPLDARSWLTLARAAVRAWLPTAIAGWRHRRRGGDLPPWLGARGREALEAADAKHRRRAQPFAHPSLARSLLCEDVALGTAFTSTQPAYQRFYADEGLELSHPFLDARVVELLLSLPFEMRAEPGLLKPALRRAMVGILPPGLLWRRHPSAYGDHQVRCFESAREAWLRLLDDSRLEAMGYLDARKLRARIEALGAEAWKKWDVLGALSTEAWLRRLDSPSAEDPRKPSGFAPG